ncbi:MAG: acyltransferase [Lachnospiraceae bacterium]|nr:acyltransferase [Lachnospiraceae bacterium]
MENGITKKQSAILQGIAVWMLVYHHMYSYTETYNSLLPFMQVAVVQRIAWFCKICVGIFAFVSGYGMYHVMSRKPAERFFGRMIEEYRYVLARILRLYGKLWLVILIFIVIDFPILGRQFVAEELWGNLTAFQPTWNGTWWYVEQYAKMLLALPFLDLLLTRFERQEEKKKWIFFLALAGVALIGILLSPVLYELLLAAAKGMRPSFSLIFIAGYIISRYGLYQRIDKLLKCGGVWLSVCTSMILVCAAIVVRVLLATGAAWSELDFLLVPVLAYGMLTLLDYVKPLGVFLAWWGDQSTYIWLTHIFFVGWLLSFVSRQVRLDILVYLAMMLFSVMAAILLKGVETGIQKGVLWLLKKNVKYT